MSFPHPNCAWCGKKINFAACCGVQDIEKGKTIMKDLNLTTKLWCSFDCRKKSVNQAIMKAVGL